MFTSSIVTGLIFAVAALIVIELAPRLTRKVIGAGFGTVLAPAMAGAALLAAGVLFASMNAELSLAITYLVAGTRVPAYLKSSKDK